MSYCGDSLRSLGRKRFLYSDYVTSLDTAQYGTSWHCPWCSHTAHYGMPLSVLDAPIHSHSSFLATARLHRSLFLLFFFPSGSRALFLSSSSPFACTEHPTPKSTNIPHHNHTDPSFQLSLVLATAPLRSLRPRPPHRLPGSTPHSHVVGVGCGRIASAIQGSGTGADLPFQERSGAVAGTCECAGRGSAPQKQRLVQKQPKGSDRHPTGARSHYGQPTESRLRGQAPAGRDDAFDAFARFAP